MSRLEQIEKMLATEPDDVFLNFGLAMEMAKDQDKGPALRQFDRVTGLDPDYSAAYYQKGRLLLESGSPEEARKTLTAGLEATKRIGDTHAASEMQDLLDLAR